MLHLAGLFLTSVFGYFPGKRPGMVGDLPGPVMRQWSRWCRHPEFAWGADPDLVCAQMQLARFELEATSFTDDQAMTGECTRELLAAMPNAPSLLHVVSPSEVGMTSIGHVGAFRPDAEQRLWPFMLKLLQRDATQSANW